MMVVLLTSIAITYAQHPISNELQKYLNTGNCRDAENAIKKYTSTDLRALPDSVLMDYYYLMAAICADEGDESNKLAYLYESKNLCEKSQGIHSPVYLEICWAIGDALESRGDTIAAFELYQAALVQSIGMYSLNDEDVRLQYEDIKGKVTKWYKNDSLRSKMISHRDSLKVREINTRSLPNDVEFYDYLKNNEPAQKLTTEADSLNASKCWGEAAKVYSNVAKETTGNPITKATLQELAAINYINAEDFRTAENLLLDNLKILENYKKSKTYRRTLSQLSNLYAGIHNYVKAKDYATNAKFWYEEALEFDRGYILCLHRCASLEYGNNNNFQALLLEDVALQELYRSNSFEINSGKATTREQFLANMLSSVSIYYKRMGFLDEAYSNLRQAIDIAEVNNLDASTYYGNIASLCLTLGRFEAAVDAGRKAYDQSNSVRKKIQLGCILCLSQMYANKPISSDVVWQSSECLNSFVNETFSFTSMDERKDFWHYYESYLPLLNFFAYYSKDHNLYSQIYNNILVEKGLLLRTTNSIKDQIFKSKNKDDIQMYDSLLRLRSLLPTLTLYESRIIAEKIENIDKYLTRKYSSYSNFKNSSVITVDNIKDNLKEDDIAIEFYNIPEDSRSTDGKRLNGEYRYCAVILKKEYAEPHIIPLFTETKLRSIEQEDYYETDSLYNLIWKPLEEELKGVHNIYFAADKDLHRIGIEYAPLPGEGIIGNKYTLYRVSSTRVLAEKKDKSSKESVVLYGGLKYDLGKDELIAESHSGGQLQISKAKDLLAENSRYGVKYLPGTLKEVEEISHNFSGSTRLITDIAGTEESFKSLASSSVDIIHLATHGFFWSEEDARKRDYVTFLSRNSNKVSGKDNALIRCGLFFSGANIGLKGEELPDDVEDGVLTALELSNMNLGHVDMVVMSACESGLGETSGEGVFGLQRGFKLAGANTLLMSLWKVDDTATQKLMTEFYRHYLSGKSKQESLHFAQESLRKSSEYSDPQYWAAFILLDGLN